MLLKVGARTQTDTHTHTNLGVAGHNWFGQLLGLKIF